MSKQIAIQYYKSPAGQLIVGSFEDQLCLCDWRYRKMRKSIDKRIKAGLKAEYQEASTKIIELTILQLEEYFTGVRKEFDIPLLFVGSDFQKRIWSALKEIPFGSTETYLGLSRKLGDEKAIRAVASANGANAISIIIPCHRLIGSDGKLVGYAGGLDAKKKLLRIEHVYLNNQMELFD